MSKTDNLWQRVVEQEKAHLSRLTAEELKAMEFFVLQTVQIGRSQIEVGLWHEEPNHRTNFKFHVFVLMAERQLLPLMPIYRKYLDGFMLDSDGAVVPIPDDILLAYD